MKEILTNEDAFGNLICLIVVSAIAIALVISAIKGKLGDWL